jgi:mannose-6-phosphate isomerase-like protein (cupin superfamily)
LDQILKLINVAEIGPMENITRVVLKETLSLTGAEISANRIPAGKESPFAHAHKRNEEVYLFIAGKGLFWLDGDIIPVKEGSMVRVSPACVRSLKAEDSEPLSYFCIQVDSGSLVQATREDGIISKVKPQW